MMTKKILLIVLLWLSCFNSLSNIIAKHVFVDEFNKLWLANENGIFCQQEGSKIKLINAEIKDVSALFSIPNMLLVGTKQGKMIGIDINSQKIIFSNDLKREVSAICLFKKTVIISTLGAGLFQLRQTQAIPIKNQTNDYVYALFSNAEQLWCASDNGIRVLDSNYHLQKNLQQELPDLLITNLCGNNKQKVWATTQNGKLLQIDSKTYTIQLLAQQDSAEYNNLYYSNNALYYTAANKTYCLHLGNQQIELLQSDKAVYSIFHKHDGNIYLAGESGIVQVRNELYQKLDNTSTLNLICGRSSGEIIMASNNKLLKKTNASQNTVATFATDISCLYKDIDNNIWIGTLGDGLHILSANNKLSKVSVNNGVDKNGILAITGSREKIWLSSLEGLWQAERSDKIFTPLNISSRKKIFYVYDLLYDSRERLWLATDGQGVYYLKDNQLFRPNSKELLNNTVYKICEDARGQIWFSTHQSGLYCLRENKSLVHLHNNNGLVSNELSAISAWGSNYIVATYNEGFQYIDINRFRTYNCAISNSTCNFNSIYTHKNNAYIGTTAGLLSLQIPDYIINNENTLKITKIENLDGKLLDPTQHEYKASANNFKFTFNAGFALNDNIYYRYKLVGYNTQWINTADITLHFLNLEPGTYSLLIQAANNVEYFQPIETSYSFHIKTPLYRRWWFVVLCSGTLIYLLIYITKLGEKRKTRLQLLEKENIISQFETLKTQVSPHFLFNSLNSLLYIIEDDKQLALEYTQKLSEFYRTKITYSNHDLISLREELEMNEKYIYLQKIRFGAQFNYQVNVDTQTRDNVRIPPLTIQMLCENMFKHNTIDKEHTLNISIDFDEHFIIVKNNINAKIGEQEGEGIGLNNIQNRYKLHKRALLIENDTQFFIVKLPKL